MEAVLWAVPESDQAVALALEAPESDQAVAPELEAPASQVAVEVAPQPVQFELPRVQEAASKEAPQPVH